MLMFVSLFALYALLGSTDLSCESMAHQVDRESFEIIPYAEQQKRAADNEEVIGNLLASSQYPDSIDISKLLGHASDQRLNTLVDFVLDVLRETIRKSGNDQIPLPDIDEDFTKKIKHFIKIKGHFKAEKGWFRSLASVHRMSDAVVVKSGSNISLALTLGLSTLQLGFDEYHAKMMHIRVKGKLRGSVGSNSVAVRVNIDKDHCKLALEDLKVTRLDGIKVKVTGLGPLDWLASKITTWVVKHSRDKIISGIETKIKEDADKALKKFHC